MSTHTPDREQTGSDANQGPDVHEALAALLRSGHRLISIVTTEEAEALECARAATGDLGLHRYVWDMVSGIRDDLLAGSVAEKDTDQPAAALYWIAKQGLPSAFVLLDLAAHLQDPKALRAMRHAIAQVEQTGGQIILIDHSSDLPDVVSAYATEFEIALPSDQQIETIVRETLRALHRERPIEIRLTRPDYRMVLKNLRGLTRRQAAQVIRDAVRDDDALRAEDLNAVLASKRRMLSGVGCSNMSNRRPRSMMSAASTA
jgi:hypothetical protein